MPDDVLQQFEDGLLTLLVGDEDEPQWGADKSSSIFTTTIFLRLQIKLLLQLFHCSKDLLKTFVQQAFKSQCS